MLSKLWILTIRRQGPNLPVSRPTYKKQECRNFSLIPPSQYDMPFPARLNVTSTMREYWEITPLILCTLFALSCMFGSIMWAINNKVDTVYSSRSRDNISRTMDLRNPTVHKLVVINQRYEPWPEMADVLEKMVHAEKRALSRLKSCTHP